jgi:hypothetical protein
MRISLAATTTDDLDSRVPTPRTTAHAKIRSAPATEARQLVGRIGIVVGETQPSSSKVDVIGGAPDDVALSVLFPELDASYWFHPDLLEPVNPDGSPFVPPPDGPWRDRSLEPRAPLDETPVTRLLRWLDQFVPRVEDL